MSARNYILSARERNINKVIDYLPQINHQKSGYRSGQELAAQSANGTKLLNRNLNFAYKIQPYATEFFDRAGTPFSDFFSESETGTPDFHSEESDSSSGSAFKRNTAEATRILQEEWDCIERTIYDEDGEKCSRPHMIEECKQWKQLHPQLRVIGKALKLPEQRLCYKQAEQEELIAMHYSDYDEFSESEERLSQSSTDVTPQNSPRFSHIEDTYEPKLTREKVSFKLHDDIDLSDAFCSLLHITPIHIRSPSHKKRPNQCIMRSDLASSKWTRKRPESSINYERNSAKSLVSLDRNYNNINCDSKILNARILTAKHRELAKLEPLYTPELVHSDGLRLNGIHPQYSIRKVSLPPLLLDEKRKVSNGSAKKIVKNRKGTSKGYLDRVKLA
ncbi:putative S-antigen protein precursor [Danaus plexippus plexippus]|uniref:S-antigen protein n=1 Tax=Danaus plexippus plexippus TaxID=278856 RepID=A0A212EPN5_DANPL|nr:putative S-antigen protein precursor [Danaus plexippus plexippus]